MSAWVVWGSFYGGVAIFWGIFWGDEVAGVALDLSVLDEDAHDRPQVLADGRRAWWMLVATPVWPLALLAAGLAHLVRFTRTAGQFAPWRRGR